MTEPDLFLKAFTFLIPVTLEIFLPCYFGNELSIASSKLSTAFFHSDWIDESKSFKNLAKIFMESSSRDLKVSTYEFFDANLLSFGKIVNAAYSLFAVFKKLNK